MRTKFRHPKKFRPEPRWRINERIRAREVRVIDEEGGNLGVMTPSEALAIAQERGYDLVEVSPKIDPPVCRILNFGQFQYEEQKKRQKQKAKQKKVELKTIRLSFRISKHDLENKLNQAKRFLNDGNRVAVEMLLRGRERQHRDIAQTIIADFINSLREISEIEQPLTRQGWQFSVIVKPAQTF